MTALVPCAFCATLNRIDLERHAHGPKCGRCQRPILLDRPVRLNEAELDRVLSGTEAPLLVDFYADWCGPCKVMAPVLDEIARARAGSVLVAKLDTDRNPRAAERFQVRSIPTLILFRGGREVQRQVGVVPRAAVEAMLDGGPVAAGPAG